MTTTDSRDVQATVDQVMRCADAGADLVRLTVQGKKEAEACFKVKDGLIAKGYGDTALVADIHFQPAVAMMIADCFEKIRINPGNYADGAKKFEDRVYETPEAYQAELDEIEETFTPLVEKCKRLGTAMRIGTNHGSLSARTLSYFGDTPAGMVESAFEYARVCRKHDYHNFLFSMKASNPVVMVQAYRLLAARMYEEGWDYPMHLGVTEAGEGEDGRMKSAIGIGTLLMDGLGDTIRVSLTEDPELEIKPCDALARAGMRACERGAGVPAYEERGRDFAVYTKRRGALPADAAGDADEGNPSLTDFAFDYSRLLHRDGSVLSHLSVDDLAAAPPAVHRALGCKFALGYPMKDLATSDSVVVDRVPDVVAEAAGAARELRRLQQAGVGILAELGELRARPWRHAVAVCSAAEATALLGSGPGGEGWPAGCERLVARLTGADDAASLGALAAAAAASRAAGHGDGGVGGALAFVIFDGALGADGKSRDPDASVFHVHRRLFSDVHAAFAEAGKAQGEAVGSEVVPIVVSRTLETETDRDLIVQDVGYDLGGSLVDGRGDGALVAAPALGGAASGSLEFLRVMSFGLLQGSRMRNTKTEYVSCPSCGRTLFDLQEVPAEIREETGHLPGVAIAVMGCIVNGPGEMADADFGYVGGAPGKIDLYVGKEVVKKGLPMAEGPAALVQLIKDHGRWVDKPVEEEVAA